MSLTMKAGQTAVVEAFKTLEQNTFTLETSWTCDWDSSDTDIVSLTTDSLSLLSNPTSRVILNAVAPGDATISVSGNGMTASLDVTVVDNDQFGLTIVAYQPTP